MQQIKLRVRQIATVSVVIAVLSFAVILILSGVSWLEVGLALLKGGGAITFTGFFWFAYNRWLWKVDALRLFGWLSPVPDLNGRWEGTVERSEGDAPHPFVVEVVQTFSSLQYQTFSRNSTGSSTAVVLTKHDEANIFGVIAAWQSKTNKLDGSGKKETFRGVSHWRLEYTDRPGRQHDRIKIIDDYYTDRLTAGVVNLTWVSKKLQNGFGEHDPAK